MSIIWFSLVSYGLTQILVYGKIFDRIRPAHGWPGELFSCSMCVGFWVGIFLWCIRDHTELINFDNSFITALLLGFAASAVSYVPNVLFGDEGFKVEKKVHIRKDVTNETINKD